MFKDQFRRIAAAAATALGSPTAFFLAVAAVIVWCVTGPMYRYSDAWQLVINTGTTIVTFLMVFLIQNTQNRDAKAIQLKLDELIRAVSQARNVLIDIENLSDDDLARLQKQFKHIREQTGASHELPRPESCPA
jgi:low affinity Fe/Cu permease